MLLGCATPHRLVVRALARPRAPWLVASLLVLTRTRTQNPNPNPNPNACAPQGRNWTRVAERRALRRAQLRNRTLRNWTNTGLRKKAALLEEMVAETP